MSKNIFNELNKQQKKAVKHVRGPSVILAGAGAGKTRVLVYKVLHLIKTHNVHPSQIVMITFTNKAAGEMKERMGDIRLGFIGTFHSLCARILRINGESINIPKTFVIYDESDQLALIKKIVKDKSAKFTPSYYLSRISSAKNELISHKKYATIFSDPKSLAIASVYEAYQNELVKNNALDFDDLILKAIDLLTTDSKTRDKYQRQYRYILVDEFQDTNLAQYVLTRILGEKSVNVTVVGDFSQSIYSWRGANIGNLEKFQRDFANTELHYLETNYRSTQTILEFAYKIISKNTTHPILHLTTANGAGEEIVFYEALNEQEEALFVTNELTRLASDEQYNTSAILYRTNAQSRLMEEALLHLSIPYVLIGGTRFYERKEIRDVLSYIRLVVNPVDSTAKDRIAKLGKKRWSRFFEIQNKLKEKIDSLITEEVMEEIFRKTGYLDLYNVEDSEDYSRIENIKELKSVAMRFPNVHDFLEQVALVESEYSEEEKKEHPENAVKLMTLHQAKGLEFDRVFIIGVEDGILPHSRSIDDFHQLEEERRLFYVGITRARKKLYITFAQKRFIFGSRGTAIKSRFLMDEEGWI